MALQKQPVAFNFGRGLDKKNDPFQIPAGKFLGLENSIFDKGGQLKKRNGFGPLAALTSTPGYLTTLNGNLTAIGSQVDALSSSTDTWVSKGFYHHADLSTLSLLRSNLNQTAADSAVHPNGLICSAYAESNGTTNTYRYVIADSTTGQNLVSPTTIPVATGTITQAPKVYLLANYFIVVFTNRIAGVDNLQYISINATNTSLVNAAQTISSNYSSPTAGGAPQFEGATDNSNLYVAWNGADVGNAVRMTLIDSTLVQHNTIVKAGLTANLLSVNVDTSGSSPVVWVSSHNSASQTATSFAVDKNLNTILAPTTHVTGSQIVNMMGTATGGSLRLFYQVQGSYSYDGAIRTDVLNRRSITQAGTLGTATVVMRGMGLASKGFIIGTTTYFLASYQSAYQSTYFLLDFSGRIVLKLAAGNGAGYYTQGLPGVSQVGNVVRIPYLIRNRIQAVNKSQGVASVGGIFAQVGVNLATIDLDSSSLNLNSVEIGDNLNITGGQLWAYDGSTVTEQGFHLYPDYIETTTSTSGGSMGAGTYYYAVTYEWADNSGNVNRSAPSIPVSRTTTGGASTVTINVPTLRATLKKTTPVKICIYRWSVAQQTYYEVTSIAAPTLNDTTVDSIAFVDTKSDAQIIGNNILYTTGGVLENIGSPALHAITLYQSRVFGINAEDRNQLVYSKVVLESTPVEMSDLLTLYVSPTTASQGSTGVMEALAPLDDKLILFKASAIYYINGSGPDNLGTSANYSEPTFVTATVGCDNQRSIVFVPNGLMFQSQKGIWILGRDLSTTFIGADVEDYTNGATVLSAVNVPDTNQVRFTLDSGVTLMYDYFFNEWGTFTNVPAISSTLYQGLHTYVNARGGVLQETPDLYLDGSKPVLLGFKTAWLKTAGLQGYQRAYFAYLLGVYKSPYTLDVAISYDYIDSPTQTVTVVPENRSSTWGSESVWGGGGDWGGAGGVEQAKIHLTQQKCEAVQLTVREVYDATQGYAAGAGLTLSGITMIIGVKSGHAKLKPSRSFG